MWRMAIYVWGLSAAVLVLVCALVGVLWDRDLVAKDLWLTRAELRRLRTAQSRKPVLTRVIPAFRDAPSDPEEFRRTQLRRVR